MGFRNKIRKRFLIILVVVVLLTGGLSIKTMMMDQKFKSSGCKDNQSGLCSDLQKWRFFPEEKICQIKQESEQNSYLTSSTDLMKYVSHDVGHLASLLHGKLRDSISCQRSERGQLEPCLDWTSRILTEDVNYQHKAVIGLLLIISCILEVFGQEIRKDKKMKIWSCPETNVFKKLKALLSNWIPLFCPPWINHDEQQQADEGLQFKQGKKYAWMKDPLRWNDCFTEYISFSVLDRVASYRPLFSIFPQTNMPSVLTLAEAGFSYPGRGLIVECQECRSVVDITNFNVEGHHHREGCSFAKQDGNMASNSSSNENQDVDTDSAEAVHIESVTLNEQVVSDEQLATFNNSSNGYQLLDETSSPITPLQNVLLSSEAGTCPKHLDIVHAVQLEHNCQDEVPEQQQANQAAETEEQQQCQSATAIQQQINPLSISPPEENGACAGSCGSTHVTHDLVAKCNATLFDLVDFDAEEEKSQGLRIDLAEACLKNPGHYTNFLMGQLQEDFIPTNARHPDVFKFMKLFGKLVVRLVVSKLSSNRPHFLKNKDESKYRFGTGIATAKYIDNDTAANMETSRKWSSVKKIFTVTQEQG
uniref:Uncharacterized protein n=1 Tax=Arion vulgaris TaxID=1028688 RepID=A0A0B7B4Q7_9EUPU